MTLLLFSCVAFGAGIATILIGEVRRDLALVIGFVASVVVLGAIMSMPAERAARASSGN